MDKSIGLVVGAFRDFVKVIGGIRKASNHRMLLLKKPAVLLASIKEDPSSTWKEKVEEFW